mgnify:FL=1|tara:strand:+ start:903 stop:1358 length:456 start_codon:yes stop_codon:yes gene_type:complete
MIHSRLATIEDSDELLNWRNDVVTRNSFFNKEVINKIDHEKWFKKILNSKTSIVVILFKDQDKIGVVRYDLIKKFINVSININPLFRQKGFGSKMLIGSEPYIHSNSCFKKDKIIAKIIKENIASVKVFKKAGYELESEENKYFIYAKEIK